MPFGKRSEASTIVESPLADVASTSTKRTSQTRDLSNGPSGKIVPVRADSISPVLQAISYLGEGNMPTVAEGESAKKKIKIRSKQSNADGTSDVPKKCFECQATETSTWRRDVLGNLICNKCGLRKRKDHKAPSRRLIRKPKEEEGGSLSPNDNHNHASEAGMDNLPPLKDPRPPRPWINHQDRQPSKVLGVPGGLSNEGSTGTPAAHHPSFSPTIPTAELGVTSDAIELPIPRLPGLNLVQQRGLNTSPKPVTPSRRPGPKKALNPLTMELKVCVSCGVDESPAWRKGPDGRPLCNKCMLRLKRAAQRQSGIGAARTAKTANADKTDAFGVGSPIAYTPQAGLSSQGVSPVRIDPRLVNRTDSQIVLDNFTHLNSSFASDSNRSHAHTNTNAQGSNNSQSQLDPLAPRFPSDPSLNSHQVHPTSTNQEVSNVNSHPQHDVPASSDQKQTLASSTDAHRAPTSAPVLKAYAHEGVEANAFELHPEMSDAKDEAPQSLHKSTDTAATSINDDTHRVGQPGGESTLTAPESFQSLAVEAEEQKLPATQEDEPIASSLHESDSAPALATQQVEIVSHTTSESGILQTGLPSGNTESTA